MKEIWKDIIGYENLYQISNYGNVKSMGNKSNHSSELIMKLRKDNGYLRVQLQKNKHKKIFCVHRLVAEAFIPNPLNKPQVNHKDGIKTNNVVNPNDLYGKTTNLEWCTRSENQKHAYKMGLQKVSEKQKLKASEIGKNRAKQISQYDLNDNFLRTFNSSMQIERELNIAHNSVIACCKRKRKTAGNYIWKYKEVI